MSQLTFEELVLRDSSRNIQAELEESLKEIKKSDSSDNEKFDESRECYFKKKGKSKVKHLDKFPFKE